MRLALLPVVPLLLVSACGGSSDDAAAGGVSKADYVAKAEAICADFNKEQAALPTPTSIPAVAPYVSKIVALADGVVEDLTALEVPKADAAEIKAKVLDPLKTFQTVGHTYADDIAAADKSGDMAKLQSLVTNRPKAGVDLTWMKDYGFDACVDAADFGS